MELFSFAIPALYSLFLLGLCTLLLVRGVTYLFVGLFACGAFLHLLQTLGYLYLRQAPGGFSANAHLFPILSAVSALGTILTAAAFLLLASFLLKTPAPEV